ncbi:hypothetical protein D3C72_1202670 [compost metagenome]
MQRGVDAGRARVQIESAMGQVGDHFIFQRQATVAALQRAQLVHVQGGKAVELDAAQVAARAFHPQHLDLVAGQVIRHADLGRGIAAAEIGDAHVGTEQVGTVQQKLRFAQGRGVRIVP